MMAPKPPSVVFLDMYDITRVINTYPESVQGWFYTTTEWLVSELSAYDEPLDSVSELITNIVDTWDDDTESEPFSLETLVSFIRAIGEWLVDLWIELGLRHFTDRGELVNYRMGPIRGHTLIIETTESYR